MLSAFPLWTVETPLVGAQPLQPCFDEFEVKRKGGRPVFQPGWAERFIALSSSQGKAGKRSIPTRFALNIPVMYLHLLFWIKSKEKKRRQNQTNMATFTKVMTPEKWLRPMIPNEYAQRLKKEAIPPFTLIISFHFVISISIPYDLSISP